MLRSLRFHQHCKRGLRGLESRAFIARSSSTSAGNEEVVIYQSKYGKRIRTVRRVSFISAMLGSLMLPAAVMVDSGVMTVTAQIALAGTVWFSSMSSTLMLHVIGSPYVYDMAEIKTAAPPASEEDRKFAVRKVSLLGNLKRSEFRLADAQKSTAHPFASFKVDKQGFNYIFGGQLEDEKLRERLCRD